MGCGCLIAVCVLIADVGRGLFSLLTTPAPK
jgi:hypothetical protein